MLSIVVYLMHEPPPHPLPRGIVPSAADPQLAFSYETFCPWERPITVEEVRRRPGLAPLAALTPGVSAADLPALGQAIHRADLAATTRHDLLAVTVVIAGRRFPLELLRSCVWSKGMEDSVTYQYILSQGEAKGEAKGEARGKAEGEAIGLRRAIVELARARLGRAPRGLKPRLAELDAESLHRLLARLLRARTTDRLQELLKL